MSLTAPPEPTEPTARTAVRKLFLTPHEQLVHLSDIHRDGFASVWRSGTHTAAEFFAEAGPQGALFMQIAGTNVAHIAAIAGMIGKTLHDYLQPGDYVPPQPYTIHGDGTITINP